MRRSRTLLIWIVVLGLLAIPCTSSALPAGFVDEEVLGGLAQPIDLQLMPDGQMLIVLRGGTILIMDPFPGPASAATYLQLPAVDSGGEKGLLSLALDPGFDTNGYFYIYYHHSGAERARVSRFVHEIDHANSSDELVVWEDHLPYTNQVISDHWGGGFGFGPDGYLYLAIGDKKDDPNEAQNLVLSAGKILRLDPSGVDGGGEWIIGDANTHLLPPDNPFADGPGGALDEIWALGLRNPFRATWDLPSGRFFIGEVGGNVQSGGNASYEDLHVVTTADGGANFGWPLCEGPNCASAPPVAYSAPLHAIQHPDSRALIAGLIYRGSLFPAQYHGRFFMLDFAKRWLRFLSFDGSGNVSPGTPSGGYPFASGLGSPVALEIGPEGALYYADLDDQSSTSGRVGRITFNGGNQPPVILEASASPTLAATAPQAVDFSGLASDPESGPVTYNWDFGDDDLSIAQNPTHTYLAMGEYIARLQVDDGQASSLAAPISIEIGVPPAPVIAEPSAGLIFRAGDTIMARGSATDADGTLTLDDLVWSVRFLHDEHSHPVLTEVIGTACAPTGSSCLSFDVPSQGHDFSGQTGFEIVLRVTDADGLTRFEAIAVDPDKVDVTFDSNVPDGISLDLDQVPRTSPFTLDTLIGFQHDVSTPDEWLANGKLYDFEQWSNGIVDVGQVYTVPSVDDTLVATYVDLGPPTRVQTGLQALYAFDDVAGSVVSDTAGVASPIDLAIADPGSVTWMAGRLSVDSSTTISGPANRLNAAIETSGAITMEAWLTPVSTNQNGPARILSLSNGLSNRNATLGQGSGSGGDGTRYDVRFRSESTGLNGSDPSTSTAPASLTTTLTHVVYTRDAGGLGQIFLDGELAASGLVAGDLSSWDPDYPLWLANEATGTRPWLGIFDLIAFYDRALSADEVMRNFAAGPDANSINEAPVARNDSFSTDEDTTIVDNVMHDNGSGIDSDPDDDPISVIAVDGSPANVGVPYALPSTALLTLHADGSFDYDPNGAFDPLDGGDSGSDAWIYKIGDPESRTDSAAVSMLISGSNDPPIMGAVADQSLDEGASLDVAVASSDIEPHGRTFSLGGGAPGFVTLSDFFDGSGSLNLAPATGEAGVYAVSVHVTDQGSPPLMDATSFSITVTVPPPVNFPPTARDDFFATDEEGEVAGQLFADNGSGLDEDLDLDPFLITAINGSPGDLGSAFLPSGASLQTTAEGNFVYSPQGAFDFLAGSAMTSDAFTYTIDDGISGPAVATVTIDIAGVNDPPVIEPLSSQIVAAGVRTEIAIQSTDPENESRSLELGSGAPSFASITDLGDGSGVLTLDPMLPDAGPHWIPIEVTDTGVPPAIGPGGLYVGIVAERIEAGVQALYTFDTGSGSTVLDQSNVVGAVDLTITDPENVTWSAGDLSIDAATVLVSDASATRINQAIKATGAVTLEAWLTPANITQTGPAVIATLSSDTSARNLTLGQGDGAAGSGSRVDVRLRTSMTDANGEPSTSTAPGSLAATLTHVVYTRNADGAIAIHVDGVMVSAGSVSGDLLDWDETFLLRLGNDGTSTHPWLGSFDLIAIYDRALSEPEVRQNFIAGANPIGVPEPSTGASLLIGLGLLFALKRRRCARMLA